MKLYNLSISNWISLFVTQHSFPFMIQRKMLTMQETLSSCLAPSDFLLSLFFQLWTSIQLLQQTWYFLFYLLKIVQSQRFQVLMCTDKLILLQWPVVSLLQLFILNQSAWTRIAFSSAVLLLRYSKSHFWQIIQEFVAKCARFSTQSVVNRNWTKLQCTCNKFQETGETSRDFSQ